MDTAQSTAGVVTALGLDAGAGADGVVIAQSVGASFPLSAPTAELMGLQLVFESGATKEFIWSIPAGSSFNSPAAFVAAHGAAVADATVSVAGTELRFDLEFNPAETVVAVHFDAKDAAFDLVTAKWGFENGLWGLDRLVVTEGVVTHAKRNTLKVSSRLVLGQAMAAFMLNELTRPEPGPDPIPNTPIVAANEGALDAIFTDVLREYHSVVAVFLDITGKRAQAFGGSMDLGIQNGAYLYTFQTYSDGQVIFGDTSSGTMAHETGHNIGFPDLYNNSSGNYDPHLNYPNDWDLMDNSGLRHPGAWAKTVRSDWVLDDVGGIDVFYGPLDPTPRRAAMSSRPSSTRPRPTTANWPASRRTGCSSRPSGFRLASAKPLRITSSCSKTASPVPFTVRTCHLSRARRSGAASISPTASEPTPSTTSRSPRAITCIRSRINPCSRATTSPRS
ncbi:MAG: hypothetical protein M5U12_08170 [Verrucomicrobia bacterium]|nr:hypothetical protein [Verrucomicrobiota bacterium]